MSDKFKVVEDKNGVLANGGPQPKDRPIQGLDEGKAETAANDLNQRAEALGIETRYKVVPLDA